MPLDSYANLQASILSWLARPDDPLVSPSIPDIIELFEREATRRLKVGGAEKRASLTALSAAVALPADFGELRLATSGSVNLTYVTPMQLPPGDGPPAHYTIIGNEMRLGPSPSGGCTVEIVYQSGVPPLSDTNTTNWLLTAHPDCYLFGSLVEAESFIGSDERIPLWAQRREAAFASIETADRKARWGGAPLSIRAEGVSGGNGTAAGDWTSAPPVPIPIAAIVAGDGLTGGGTEGIVTISLDAPVDVAHGGTGNTSFAVDHVLTGGGPGVQASSATVSSFGDVQAASYTAIGVGTAGAFWWEGAPGENWAWYSVPGKAYLGQFDDSSFTVPIRDSLQIDWATGGVTAAGDIYATSCSANGLGLNGGFWFNDGIAPWAWYASAGSARLGKFDSGGGFISDVFTIDHASGVVTAVAGLSAPTPAPGDNDTSVATTAFVQAALAAGGSGINQLTGDVTAGPGSGSQAAAIAANAVTTAKIAAGNVTYAKVQNITAARLLGNPTGGAAAPSEISLGTNLSFAGSVLNATAGASGLSGMTAGQVPVAATATTVTSSVPTGTSGNSTVVQTNASGNLVAAVMPAYTGDVTSPAGSIANTLATVNANVGTFQGLTVNAKGLVTAAAAQGYLTSSGISGMTAGQIPIAATATTVTSSGNLSGAVTTSGSLATTLAANAVATANITNANVTYAKIQNVAANRLLGNSTGSAAAPAEIALPLAVGNGGTGASTLPLTTGGVSMALTGTFLQTNGVVAGSATAASGTVGTWGGGNVVAMGAGAEADLTMSRCTGTLASPTAVATGTVLGGVLWYGYAATTYANTAGIVAATSDTFTGSAQGTLLQFYATPTGTVSFSVKMTLQSGLQIGTPTGGDKGAGTINAVTVYGNNVVLTSDERLKTDVEPLPPCLALVEAVEPKSFRWAVPAELPERPNGEGRLTVDELAPAGFFEDRNLGFLAQEVGAAFPEARTIAPDGEESVSLGALTAVLWRAVQELSAKVAALEGKPS